MATAMLVVMVFGASDPTMVSTFFGDVKMRDVWSAAWCTLDYVGVSVSWSDWRKDGREKGESREIHGQGSINRADDRG